MITITNYEVSVLLAILAALCGLIPIYLIEKLKSSKVPRKIKDIKNEQIQINENRINTKIEKDKDSGKNLNDNLLISENIGGINQYLLKSKKVNEANNYLLYSIDNRLKSMNIILDRTDFYTRVNISVFVLLTMEILILTVGFSTAGASYVPIFLQPYIKLIPNWVLFILSFICSILIAFLVDLFLKGYRRNREIT